MAYRLSYNFTDYGTSFSLKTDKTDKNRSFASMRSSHYLLIAVFLFLFASRLVQDGMFIDGVTYAAISNNMAHGMGSFWSPKFSDTFSPVFYGHPPLMFGIQSLFFWILGDGYGTERIYCALVSVLTMILLVRIWLCFFRKTGLEKFWPTVLLLWMLNEDTYLSYTGNMLECTMSIFDLLAVLILLLKWPVNQADEGSKKQAWIFITGAAAALVAAFLTKGPAGLYPLAFFVVYRVAGNISFSEMAKYTLGMSLVFCAFTGVFFLFDTSSFALKSWFDMQVVAALQGRLLENVAPHRLYILQRFLETHAHWLVIGGLLWYFLIKRKSKTRLADTQKPMLFAALLGAAALLPIILSPKQAPHYIVPALPWIALALGAWYVGITGQMKPRHSVSFVIQLVSIALMLAAAGQVMINTGKTLKRSADELGDVRELMKVLPPGGTIAYTNGDLPMIMNGYFQRYNYTAIDNEMKQHKYWMVPKGMAVADTVPMFYQFIRLDTRLYDVYMKR